MSAIHHKYGDTWQGNRWLRVTLSGFVGALEGSGQIDDILDEMSEMAKLISDDIKTDSTDLYSV